jgi:hypothetical protein
VLIELKAIEKLVPVHEAQLMTYLRLSGLPVGLLINFNVALLKEGLIRRANARPWRQDLSSLQVASTVNSGACSASSAVNLRSPL